MFFEFDIVFLTYNTWIPVSSTTHSPHFNVVSTEERKDDKKDADK